MTFKKICHIFGKTPKFTQFSPTQSTNLSNSDRLTQNISPLRSQSKINELWSLCCIMMFRSINKQPGIHNLWKLWCYYQYFYDWISPINILSGSWFILTLQSMGENEYGTSGHLSIFHFFEALVMMLLQSFQGFMFTLLYHRQQQHVGPCNSYPFHIAKFAVTPHWTPLSIHPLCCCCYTPVRFGLLSHRVSDFRILASAVYKTEQDRAEEHHHPNALFGLSLRIIRCTLSHWKPHRRKLRLLARIRFQNTSRGSSRPPT